MGSKRNPSYAREKLNDDHANAKIARLLLSNGVGCWAPKSIDKPIKPVKNLQLILLCLIFLPIKTKLNILKGIIAIAVIYSAPRIQVGCFTPMINSIVE
jgi:hypothetical protein